MPGAEGLLAVHPPAAPPGPSDEDAEAEMERVKAEVTALRAWRDKRGLARRARVVAEGPHALTCALAQAEDVTNPALLTSKVLLPWGSMAVGAKDGEVSADHEKRRLEEELARVHAELDRARKQLANPRFVQRAPEHLVQAERDKEHRFTMEGLQLEQRLAELE
jgi:valyl-tRNA synthetase